MTPESGSVTERITAAQVPEFSLVLGGPLFQFYRRAHLSGSALELLPLRVLVITLFAWLPLLILSLVDGHFVAGSIKLPFFDDIESHARFLVALPTLIAGEVLVHWRLLPVLQKFLETRIVGDADLPRFRVAVESAMRARNSAALEVALLVSVYTLGIWFWRIHVSGVQETWYAIPHLPHAKPMLAGYWYVFVSIPLFQFILLRWYLRLVLWFRLLWQISRLRLHLSASHPDRAGGLGFLGTGSNAFLPLLFAQGVLLSGLIAGRILYNGRSLQSFKIEIAGFVGFFVLSILGPLLMFSPQLERTKRRCSADYGVLVNRCVFAFEQKWIQDPGEPRELLGSNDAQSLADLASCYSNVSEMRLVPFEPHEVARLAVATTAPLLPLLLFAFSLRDLLTQLAKLIFW